MSPQFNNQNQEIGIDILLYNIWISYHFCQLSHCSENITREKHSSPGSNPGSNTEFSCHVAFVSLSFFHLSLLIWNSCFIFFVFHDLYIMKLSGQLIHSRFIPWFDLSDISLWLDLGYTYCPTERLLSFSAH